MRKADQLKEAHAQGRHTPNGYPHYATNTGLCMCTDYCCHRSNGCVCKGCICRILRKDHSELLSILGNTILSIGKDFENNGSLEVLENGGKNNDG